MPNTKLKRLETLPTIARTSPVSIILLMIIYAIMIPSFNSFYLVILLLLTNVFNVFLKYGVMKPLYKWLNSNDLFLLGSGSRPPGAMNCEFSIDGKKATSFGMPSGHSQIAWTIGIYLICNLIYRFINNLNNQNNPNKAEIIMYNILIFISIIVILSAIIYISYSRVYIEGCHTIQQVSVGSIVGLILGFLAFFFEDHIKCAILE